jgi:hypothetical protein
MVRRLLYVVREAELPLQEEDLAPPTLPPQDVWGKALHLVDVTRLRRAVQTRYKPPRPALYTGLPSMMLGKMMFPK